jgi:hypothetical protein
LGDADLSGIGIAHGCRVAARRELPLLRDSSGWMAADHGATTSAAS